MATLIDSASGPSAGTSYWISTSLVTAESTPAFLSTRVSPLAAVWLPLSRQ
jgi:hypothetical protein